MVQCYSNVNMNTKTAPKKQQQAHPDCHGGNEMRALLAHTPFCTSVSPFTARASLVGVTHETRPSTLMSLVIIEKDTGGRTEL